MIVTEQQNTMANGYGHSISKKHALLAAWAKFYGLKNGFPLFSDACSRVAAEKAGKADNNTGYRGADGKEIGRFVELQGGWQRVFLDTLVYRERMRISVETFLAEAEERAKEVGQQAFVHIVGLGLGVRVVFHMGGGPYAQCAAVDVLLLCCAFSLLLLLLTLFL